ncbi:MAG: zinc-finger domain-containing protein [Pseudomonadota bacterium]|nr:zinc-finger domain-containing protein [Pseudomonadota bacterium]
MPKLERACTLRRYDVTKADLPLSCPMPDMRLWDAHPRVYLPIEETGHVVCPYCDAEYFLSEEDE